MGDVTLSPKGKCFFFLVLVSYFSFFKHLTTHFPRSGISLIVCFVISLSRSTSLTNFRQQICDLLSIVIFALSLPLTRLALFISRQLSAFYIASINIILCFIYYFGMELKI